MIQFDWTFNDIKCKNTCVYNTREVLWLIKYQVIGGGFRGREGRTSPRAKFLHFHAVFGENWWNIMLGPPSGVGVPLWVILDPPLQVEIYRMRNRFHVKQCSLSLSVNWPPTWWVWWVSYWPPFHLSIFGLLINPTGLGLLVLFTARTLFRLLSMLMPPLMVVFLWQSANKKLGQFWSSQLGNRTIAL